MIVSIATNSVTIEFEGQATPRSAFKMAPQIKPQSHTEHFTLLLFVTICYYWAYEPELIYNHSKLQFGKQNRPSNQKSN